MKIGIIGPTGSGKTSYLLGMIKEMIHTECGFSIRISDPKTIGDLKDKMLKLTDKYLSANERWPVSSTSLEEYTLELFDNRNKYVDIQWIECPSELFKIAQGQERLAKTIGSVDFLFVCVDGSLLQGNEDALEDIADDFHNKSGCDIRNALMCVSLKSDEAFPPVCILITKYDAVSPALRKQEPLQEILQLIFPELFQQKSGIVAICPVSLGKNIAEGGRVQPKNVHLPMLAALYLYIHARLHLLPDTSMAYQMMAAQKTDLLQEIRDLPVFYNGKLWQWSD